MSKPLSIANPKAAFDVVGLGSALLDLIIEVDESFLRQHGLTRAQMHLIDAESCARMLKVIEAYPVITAPGGSAANTITGILNFDGTAAFQGTVGNDQYGDIYINETRQAGVETRINRSSAITGHAFTFITPDGERTFAVHLGAALEFSKKDIDEGAIRDAKIIHFEGFFFEPPHIREACMHALSLARKHRVLVSLDLSDPGLIGRIGDVLKLVVNEYADIVFANEEEAAAFTGKNGIDSVRALASQVDFAVVKLGGKGSLIQTCGEVCEVPVFATNVVNTNGAGDMYAAGVLYGITHGLSPLEAGRLGSYAASIVISEVGARTKRKIDPGTV